MNTSLCSFYTGQQEGAIEREREKKKARKDWREEKRWHEVKERKTRDQRVSERR